MCVKQTLEFPGWEPLKATLSPRVLPTTSWHIMSLTGAWNVCLFSELKNAFRVGEMALFKQWLLFQKTQAQFLARIWRLLSLLTSVSQGPTLWPLWALHRYGIHTCPYTRTHTNFCYPNLSALLEFILLNTTVCLPYQEVVFFREATTRAASSTL